MANAPPAAAGNGTGLIATSQAPPVVRQRDPPTFNGLDGQDVDDWLDEFGRVCRHNRWDDSSKLNNVAFYLSSVAKTWFLNHEAEFQSWEQFAGRLRDLFGRPAFRKIDAEQQLSSRTQQPEESYMSYVEDVLSLCKRCNPDMSDAEKIRYILKGVREDAFQLLMGKDFTTVDEILAFCKKLQDARNLRNRATYLQYGATTDIVSLDNLRTLIREIVREELSRQMPTVQQAQRETPTFVQSIVRDELASAMGPCTVPHRTVPQPTYADIVRSNSPTEPTTAAMSQVASVLPFAQPPASFPVAQARRRITCYYCGIPGHTMRVCRKRQREEFWPGRSSFRPPQNYANPRYESGPFDYTRESSYFLPPRNDSSGEPCSGDYAPRPRRPRSPGGRWRSTSRSPARLRSPPPRGNT